MAPPVEIEQTTEKPLSNKRNQDIGWEHGVQVDRNKCRWQCNWCGIIKSGGVTRLKKHLAGAPDVCKCPCVPEEIVIRMRKHLRPNILSDMDLMKSLVDKKYSYCDLDVPKSSATEQLMRGTNHYREKRLRTLTQPIKVDTPEDKVCEICGSVGYSEDIVTCFHCKEAHVHTYCVNQHHFVTQVWYCEECPSDPMSGKGGTMKSSRPDANGRKPLNKDYLLNYEGQTSEYENEYPGFRNSVHNKQHIVQPSSRSFKKFENAKVKYIPSEELLTKGRASQIKKTSVFPSAWTSREITIHAPPSRSSSGDISLSKSSKAIHNQQVQGTTNINLQSSRVTAGKAVDEKERNLQSCKSSDVFGTLRKEPLKNSAGLQVSQSSEAHTTHAQRKGAITAPPLLNNEELKITSERSLENECYAVEIKEEPADERNKLVLDWPLNTIEMLESKCNVSPLPSDTRNHKLGIDTGYVALIKKEPEQLNNALVSDSLNKKCMDSNGIATPSDAVDHKFTINSGKDGLITHLSDNRSRALNNETPANYLPTCGPGNNINSHVQFDKSGYQKRGPQFPLLIVSDDEHPHLPVTEPLWLGEFEVVDVLSQVYEGIQAHIPGKVALKAYNMVQKLPGRIKSKLRHRLDLWPKKFELYPPAYDDIGLYFFPCQLDRFKEKFIYLIELIDKNDLAMQSWIGDVELLIFSSKQLSKDYAVTGLPTEKFMWGAFRLWKCKKHSLNRQELVPAEAHVSSACTMERNTEVKMRENLKNRTSLLLRSNSNRMVVDSDIGSPPGFAEPFIENRDYYARSNDHKRVASPPSDFRRGFSRHYNRRNGNSSTEEVINRDSNFSRYGSVNHRRLSSR